MSAVADLGAYLATQSLGTVATDIFVNGLSDSPDAQIGLTAYQGPQADYTLGPTVAFEHARVQVLVRAAPNDYQAAETKAHGVYAVLDVAETDLNGTRYSRVMPLHVPYPLEQDKSDRWVFVINVAMMQRG